MTFTNYSTLDNKGTGRSKAFKEEHSSVVIKLPTLATGAEQHCIVYVGRKTDEACIRFGYKRDGMAYSITSPVVVDNPDVLHKYHINFKCIPPNLKIFRQGSLDQPQRLYIYRKPEDAQSIEMSRKNQGYCPICGAAGEWVRTALVCPVHHAFAGF